MPSYNRWLIVSALFINHWVLEMFDVTRSLLRRKKLKKQTCSFPIINSKVMWQFFHIVPQADITARAKLKMEKKNICFRPSLFKRELTTTTTKEISPSVPKKIWKLPHVDQRNVFHYRTFVLQYKANKAARFPLPSQAADWWWLSALPITSGQSSAMLNLPWAQRLRCWIWRTVTFHTRCSKVNSYV